MREEGLDDTTRGAAARSFINKEGKQEGTDDTPCALCGVSLDPIAPQCQSLEKAGDHVLAPAWIRGKSWNTIITTHPISLISLWTLL